MVLGDAPLFTKAFEISPIIGFEFCDKMTMPVAVAVAEGAEGNQIGRIIVELITVQMMHVEKVPAVFKIDTAALALVLSSGPNLCVDDRLLVNITGASSGSVL